MPQLFSVARLLTSELHGSSCRIGTRNLARESRQLGSLTESERLISIASRSGGVLAFVWCASPLTLREKSVNSRIIFQKKSYLKALGVAGVLLAASCVHASAAVSPLVLTSWDFISRAIPTELRRPKALG